MSWICNNFGHKFSQWLEGEGQQERWCKRCQFKEIARLELPHVPQCSKGLHRFGTWREDDFYKCSMQIRFCKDCGIKDTRDTW